MTELRPEPTAPLSPDAGTIRIGILGAGQFSGSFATLWDRHPNVSHVRVADLLPERAEALASRLGHADTAADFEALLASDVDAIAVMTQRWTHAPYVLAALEAGKHVYSAVPMATAITEIEDIIAAVERTGLTYTMGETSYYNPAVVWARQKIAAGELGRVFYSEGDYVHDMDNGFYAAYQYSGGENWKSTASYPPMLYPTHAIGGVLGAVPTRAVSVSCLGIVDDRGDGVFDENVSLWRNNFSNMSALFELADGGAMRTNEFRRVGYWRGHESRFRYYGTESVMEQTGNGASLSIKTDGEDYAKGETLDISDLFYTTGGQIPEDLGDIDPALIQSFVSGTAKVHDRTRLPKSFDDAPNGHEGSHHYLADDFVRAAVTGEQPPVDAHRAALFTAPGIVALDSARAGGQRLPIPDFRAPRR
ncbi:Gfo/Idh/MocA family protein [Tessaracoccus caeni]|uniref:Gfo/Idh/MocA family protein n=1 Tax=Tessaracoccus caeni TaxID=3031239 RepID=UPI0023DBC343|nr:Gfo/Idh/MocA family oxidoreductase [Tessaracoccus caeni]MDF1490186.1 Gfo/Idh/MocA family oxidoreductase [Tessaracoccus caeni]